MVWLNVWITQHRLQWFSAIVLTLFKQYDIFCEMLEMKCVDISLYLRFSCFNNRITDMSDNAKPGATQCLLTVLNYSIVWCTMKGLCHVFFAFVMLLCDLIVPDILEYFTNVRYCVWCLPCWTNNAWFWKRSRVCWSLFHSFWHFWMLSEKCYEHSVKYFKSSEN